MRKTIETTLRSILPCYTAGTKIGTIKTAYAVVVDGGTQPQEGTRGLLGQRIYEVIVLVPLDKQDEMEALLKKIQKALRNIKNLKFTGESEPTGIEQEFRGAAKSLLYRQPIRL